jgi:hypothetical protein
MAAWSCVLVVFQLSLKIMQADRLNKDAAAAQSTNDIVPPRLGRDATSMQNSSIDLTCQAEASWAESLLLDLRVSKLSHAVDTGQRKARRLVEAGNRAAEAVAAVDAIAEHEAAGAAAKLTEEKAACEVDARSKVRGILLPVFGLAHQAVAGSRSMNVSV